MDLVGWCAQHVPRWHPVSFASYNYRENAITAPQELGLLFANAIAYLEEELRRGRLRIDDFAPAFPSIPSIKEAGGGRGLFLPGSNLDSIISYIKDKILREG